MVTVEDVTEAAEVWYSTGAYNYSPASPSGLASPVLRAYSPPWVAASPVYHPVGPSDEIRPSTSTIDGIVEGGIGSRKRSIEESFEASEQSWNKRMRVESAEEVAMACSKGDDDETIKLECLYGSIQVPRSLLLQSPVWADALEIAELAVHNSAPAAGSTVSTGKRTKLDDNAPMTLIDSVDAMRIVFGILSGDPQHINQKVKYTSSRSGDPYCIASEVIEIADKYDLPGVRRQFVNQLWALAVNSEEEAIVVYAIAFEQRQTALARHAMRHFKDTKHSIKLKQADAFGDQNQIWRFLVQALWDHREEPLDWAKVADEISYPPDWNQNIEIAQDLDLFCGRDHINLRQGERVRLRSEDA